MTQRQGYQYMVWGIEAEIRAIEKRIACEMEKRQAAFDALTRTTPTYSGETVQGTKDPHKLDRIVELETAIDDLIDQLAAEKIALANVKKEICEAVACISDSRYRYILNRRLVDGAKVTDIASEIKKTERQTYNLIGDAMKELEVISGR